MRPGRAAESGLFGVRQHELMDDAPPTGRSGLSRFLDDLRRSGTVVTGPEAGEPQDEWDPVAPVEWLISVHRGAPVDPPYRLRLDEEEFAAAVEHDAGVLQQWWPGGDRAARARDALLLSFDAALVGIDGTPHGFVLEADDVLHLTTHHPCPDPVAHLDPDDGAYFWSAHAPGDPEFEEELARAARRSRHRRHADLVRAWLVVEAATDAARLDPAVHHLQDQVIATFGPPALQRFSEHVGAWGLGDQGTDSALVDIAHSDDERLDALLDALAGEPRSG
jgi:hypothetical protein